MIIESGLAIALCISSLPIIMILSFADHMVEEGSLPQKIVRVAISIVVITVVVSILSLLL